MSWVVFKRAFVGRFFPRELREAKVREFLTLKKESISLHEYNLKFTQLSRYASEMVADMRSIKSLFVSGFSRLPIKEDKVAMLIGDMDIARLMIHVQKVKEDKLSDREEFRSKKAKIIGNESGQQKNNANRSSFQQKSSGPAPSSASAPELKNRGHFMGARPKNKKGSGNGGNRAQSSSVDPSNRVATR
ncbi:uncharacterized protein LOC125828327 [Solanum verrucosum]|uniref:uncharacterized protein LOC125828327 n=1 Tax=Solanum verrucosum TaxID=315347 RepID=UPI0020D07C5E|nr:uncharacterized protein LOC125828327 [Solanum verrucosum]